MAKVFISYRRDDSAGHAGRVHDRLAAEFGRDLLFMDVDAIPLGVNFARVLSEEVAKCDVLLAVIGPGWLDACDEAGARRLDNAQDFVRIEIATALKRDIPVIPILLEGTRMPKAERLPDDIRELALRNALDVRHGSFHADMDKLVRGLKQASGAQPKATSAAQAQPVLEDPDQLYKRATDFYFGRSGRAKDEREAVRLYKLAADQGHAAAQIDLGDCYLKGIGVAKDGREAVRLYKLAADQGHARAQFKLGVCYTKGIGVAKDEREAVRLYKLAADQGYASAQINLGVCHANGTGVAKNKRESVRLYKLAADQGDAYAQFYLGVCHANGTGVAKDEREAVRLYKLAADQGKAIAQFNLGVCYANGTGVAKDEREAVRLFRLAAAQGDEDARAALKRRGLSPEPRGT